MPKYDAFGREIGENTLSGLGTCAAYFEHGRYVLGDSAGRYQRSCS